MIPLNPGINRWATALSAGLGLTLLSGCAINYETGDRVTTLGLVWVEYRKPPAAEPTGPTERSIKLGKQKLASMPVVIQQKAIGAALDTTRASGGLTLGYRNSILVFPRQDHVTYVDYDSAAPLAASVIVTNRLTNETP